VLLQVVAFTADAEEHLLAALTTDAPHQTVGGEQLERVLKPRAAQLVGAAPGPPREHVAPLELTER